MHEFSGFECMNVFKTRIHVLSTYFILGKEVESMTLLVECGFPT